MKWLMMSDYCKLAVANRNIGAIGQPVSTHLVHRISINRHLPAKPTVRVNGPTSTRSLSTASASTRFHTLLRPLSAPCASACLGSQGNQGTCGTD